MRLVVTAVLAIAGLAVIGSGSADAQTEGISIEPANPTSDDDVLITIFQGTPCIIEDAALNPSHSIEGNKITVTIDVDQDVCLAALDAFTVTENVGKLAPGTYDVEAKVDLTKCCFFVDVHHGTFEVTGPTPSPEPSPGALPTPSPTPSPGALPSTGGAPPEQGRATLALVAALALVTLGATAIASQARAGA